MIRPSPPRRGRDSTIALINIVFLMLIFFLIAGTVAPPLDREIDLVDTSGLVVEGVVQKRDGTLSIKADRFWRLTDIAAAPSHDFR